MTLGTYERAMLADYIEATQNSDSQTLKGVLDTMNAVAMPVALVGAAYLAYLGAVNLGTGVDELKQRAAATPVGQTAKNIFRYNPVWRGLNWFFGGENEPIFSEDQGGGLDVSQGEPGEGGGGGSRTGVFGGSVFM